MVKESILTLCLHICEGIFLAGSAQGIPHFIETLTTEEGLSSNSINDLAQDDDGFLWIATPDGLNRFDGTEIIHYYHIPGTNSLPHNYVYCLKKMPGDFLAIGTEAGLGFYDGNTGAFQNFYYQQHNSLDQYNNTIVELETDAYGNLWAASKNCIFIFDSSRRFTQVIHSPFTEADALKERLRFVEKILPLSNGDVLLHLHNGWQMYSHAQKTLVGCMNTTLLQQGRFADAISTLPVSKNPEEYSCLGHVFKVYEKYFCCLAPDTDSLWLFDESGRQLRSCFFPYNKYPSVLWSQQIKVIDSSNLIFLFHNYGFSVIPVSWQHNIPALSMPSPLLAETCEYNTAMRDRQGNWWFATTNMGLRKISPGKQFFNGWALTDHGTGKPVRDETTACSQYRNLLWVATYGNGFFAIDLLSGRQQQYHLNNTGNDTWANFIWNIRQVSRDTIWIGTQAGLFWYKISSKRHGRIPSFPGKPGALDTVAITTQFMDSHGLVWMGLGKGNGVCNFDTASCRFTWYSGRNASAYPLRYPTDIAEDSRQNLWFANDASAALVHWNRVTGQFQTISLPSSIPKQIGNLSGLCTEGDSVLWLGSITSGLIRFHPYTGEIQVYGHEKGLPNCHINSIYEDAKGRIWLVTQGGLSCFDQHTETFINYGVKDGLPVSWPTASFYFNAVDKRLYTGGNGNCFYFDPDKISPVHSPERTLITLIQVNGKTWFPDKAAQAGFNAQQNDITICYTAVDLTNGPATRYAYSLSGADTGWVKAGSQRQINFSHLAPGSYTFMVRATNNSGIWNSKPASINFRIYPPFTKTSWFYLLLVLASGALIYSLYRYRGQQINRTKLIRSEISRNLHDEVGANLTNISLSSLLAQKQLQHTGTVNQLLERIYQDSQTVSEAMREIVWSINPKIDRLGDALPRMLHYAAGLLEANNIELQAAIAPEVERLKLTMRERRNVYMIFKEAVNNIAKHSKAAHAAISFRLSGHALLMTITDDGLGFDTSLPWIQNGLRNMQDRARGHHWQLVIKSRPGAGTSISLHT